MKRKNQSSLDTTNSTHSRQGSAAYTFLSITWSIHAWCLLWINDLLYIQLELVFFSFSANSASTAARIWQFAFNCHVLTPIFLCTTLKPSSHCWLLLFVLLARGAAADVFVCVGMCRIHLSLNMEWVNDFSLRICRHIIKIEDNPITTNFSSKTYTYACNIWRWLGRNY